MHHLLAGHLRVELCRDLGTDPEGSVCIEEHASDIRAGAPVDPELSRAGVGRRPGFQNLAVGQNPGHVHREVRSSSVLNRGSRTAPGHIVAQQGYAGQCERKNGLELQVLECLVLLDLEPEGTHSHTGFKGGCEGLLVDLLEPVQPFQVHQDSPFSGYGEPTVIETCCQGYHRDLVGIGDLHDPLHLFRALGQDHEVRFFTGENGEIPSVGREVRRVGSHPLLAHNLLELLFNSLDVLLLDPGVLIRLQFHNGWNVYRILRGDIPARVDDPFGVHHGFDGADVCAKIGDPIQDKISQLPHGAIIECALTGQTLFQCGHHSPVLGCVPEKVILGVEAPSPVNGKQAVGHIIRRNPGF